MLVYCAPCCAWLCNKEQFGTLSLAVLLRLVTEHAPRELDSFCLVSVALREVNIDVQPPALPSTGQGALRVLLGKYKLTTAACCGISSHDLC